MGAKGEKSVASGKDNDLFKVVKTKTEIIRFRGEASYDRKGFVSFRDADVAGMKAGVVSGERDANFFNERRDNDFGVKIFDIEVFVMKAEVEFFGSFCKRGDSLL